jgi:RNA polymerase sigma-70 factor (sigma-E family)
VDAIGKPTRTGPGHPGVLPAEADAQKTSRNWLADMTTPAQPADVYVGMKIGQEFEDFVRARSAALLRTAYALAGDYGHAEDMLQTTLLRTARHWPAARDAPEAYARQVLVNLCRDRWRWLRRRPPETALADETGPVGALDGPAEQVSQHMSIIAALARLPASQRRVIVLRFLEDQSVADTASLLGITQGTVKSHAARGLRSLRLALGDDHIPDNNHAAPRRSTHEVFDAH